ncbi:MAG: tRNA uridine-5-carboxymethylaminomethyl(34) synthesis GTPase MnmE [Candidatus Omnitrophica bacterium]|nr:tRNA uridine-5-carboxymethylaminomethyl(34) synthesis GTPase MnmE [Candidatus Omnitrophota bacterium]
MKTDTIKTICAISTPLGVSGIGIIRLSGPLTYKILDKIFVSKRKDKVSSFPSHAVHYGHIVDNGRVIDEVLLTIMRRPRSYTREDMAEIGCHGGLLSLKNVLRLCLEQGCHLATAGEFTKRAFLNGRIDLAQAEAVIDIINSKTERGLEASLLQLKGHLSQEIRRLREKAVSLLAKIEVSLDFVEEDLKFIALPRIKEELMEIEKRVEELLKGAESGKIISQGINTAIIGRPNVGKSSLLNAFLREERAIVTKIPGTTRDTIEEIINLNGIPLRIIDTAGIRRTTRAIEVEGVRRSKDWLRRADLVLLVIDSSQSLNNEDLELIKGTIERKSILILNKIDLPLRINLERLKGLGNGRKIVKISATKSIGLEDLEKIIYALVWDGKVCSSDQTLIINSRHQELLFSVAKNVKDALKATARGESSEFIALDLREGLENLNKIVGENITDEILNEIFSHFCVGK